MERKGEKIRKHCYVVDVKTQPRKARELGGGDKIQLKLYVFILFPFTNWLRWLLPPHVFLMCIYVLLELNRVKSCL